jgi:hypothetical protein
MGGVCCGRGVYDGEEEEEEEEEGTHGGVVAHEKLRINLWRR